MHSLSIKFKLVFIVAAMTAFCHASNSSSRFFRLGSSIGFSYDFFSLQNNAGYRNTNLERNNYVHYETVSLGIPVLAHFQSKSIFYFDAGLTFAFVIDAKEGYYRNRNSSVGLRTRWDGTGVSFCDLQLTTGTGILLGDRLELGLQSLFGLTTVLDASKINKRYDDISVHQLSFSIALGYYFI